MLKSFIYSFIMLIIFSCEYTEITAIETDVVRENEKIYIVDITNKKWDITHAVEVYNFKAEYFNHGIGPYAITPINNPDMISPGETGYPGSNETMQIIGTTLYNSTRAYPLNVLTRHEIVNEKFVNNPIAIGY